MNEISEENRREANEKVDKSTREKQVLSILYDLGELTPKQVARYMAYRGNTNEIDYNHARPRLTGLLEKREVCIVGRELDQETNCKEGLYKITQKGIERINGDMIEENMQHIPNIL